MKTLTLLACSAPICVSHHEMDRIDLSLGQRCVTRVEKTFDILAHRSNGGGLSARGRHDDEQEDGKSGIGENHLNHCYVSMGPETNSN